MNSMARAMHVQKATAVCGGVGAGMVGSSEDIPWVWLVPAGI